MRHLLACLVFVLLACSPAGAAERMALVIGISKYQNVQLLPNAANDAASVSRALRSIGFEVVEQADSSFESMRQSLKEFGRRATGARQAIVYYAGHGMEIDRQNYLVPADAQLLSDRDVAYEAIPLDLVLSAVEGASELRLVLLDACRNNPFASRMKVTSATRSIGRGLARIEPETGTLVSFAAKEGTVAADGDGSNSPYTAALLENLATPGLEVSMLFRRVHDKVVALTRGQQTPFVYGSLPARDFFLVAAGSAVVEAPEPENPAPPSPDAAALELTFWKTVESSRDPADFRAYLERFPDGVFAQLARNRLKQLTRITALPPEPAPEKPAPETPAPAPARPGFTDWMSGQQYQTLFNRMVKRNHYPEYVEGRSVNGVRSFRIKFSRAPSGRFNFHSYHGLDAQAFAARHAELGREGYRLLFQQRFSDKRGVSIQATWVRQ